MEDFVRWHSPRDWIDEEVITSDGSKIEGTALRTALFYLPFC